MLIKKVLKALFIAVCFTILITGTAFAAEAEVNYRINFQEIGTDPANIVEPMEAQSPAIATPVTGQIEPSIRYDDGRSQGVAEDAGGYTLTDDEKQRILLQQNNSSNDRPVSYPPDYEPVSEAILQRQIQINGLIFETYAEQISDQGFTVTHTGPYADYVEVGITPYNEENLNFMIQILGNDKVKVVEGQQATTMEIAMDGFRTEGAIVADMALTGINNGDEFGNKTKTAQIVALMILGLVLLLTAIYYVKRKRLISQNLNS